MRQRPQSSLNLGLGSSVASIIRLTVPVVAVITCGTPRTNLRAGIVHLVLLATFILMVFAP